MSNEPSSAADARRRVTELVREARICMLTTIAVDGRLVSRPMGLQEAEFDGDRRVLRPEARRLGLDLQHRAGGLRPNREVSY
ncbi:pyridoxamine 5'-phosphate oxidase family protein [Micromonospora sp. NPDC047465]|uniref:pyridoxamine 5'-phosphate oxidase family protein n=1 Tax=Micromonospora sp. NPDC047465 TaxID=3154813 RepID=UPI0033E40C5B